MVHSSECWINLISAARFKLALSLRCSKAQVDSQDEESLLRQMKGKNSETSRDEAGTAALVQILINSRRSFAGLKLLFPYV